MLRAEPPMYWPQRAYKWGTAEAFNADHSDLLSLRCVVLCMFLRTRVLLCNAEPVKATSQTCCR